MYMSLDILRKSFHFWNSIAKECGEVFQVKTPPPSYRCFEEISLEVCLHFIVFKNVKDTLITLSRHSEVQRLRSLNERKRNMYGLKVENKE